MNATPLLAATPPRAAVRGAQASSRPVRRARLRPRRKPPTPRIKKQPAWRKKAKKKKLAVNPCRGRLRYGRFCLGRLVGPALLFQRIRCPHDGYGFRVTSLRKPWVPRKYDSDLRPHMGHYKTKDRFWLCPRCGYAAYARDFFKPYPRKRMEMVLSRHRIVYKRGEKIPLSYLFRMVQASYWVRKRDVPFFTRLLLHAMWAGREQKQLVFSHKMRKLALAGLRLGLKRKLYAADVRPKMAYLVAELLRQQGQFKRALRWLERALLWLPQRKKSKRLTKRRRQQRRWLERIILSAQQKVAQRKKEIYVLP